MDNTTIAINVRPILLTQFCLLFFSVLSHYGYRNDSQQQSSMLKLEVERSHHGF